jgi:hypothetical protein
VVLLITKSVAVQRVKDNISATRTSRHHSADAHSPPHCRPRRASETDARHYDATTGKVGEVEHTLLFRASD